MQATAVVHNGTDAGFGAVRVFDSNLHSRMPLIPTPLLRLKLLQACDQWHSSRASSFLTSSHCKLRPNTEGQQVEGCNTSAGADGCLGSQGGGWRRREGGEEEGEANACGSGHGR
jgi:hypothetical protein